MRFFNSRIHSRIYGGRFFITSERQSAKYPRYYTVREAHEDGDITSVSEFQQYASLNGAIAAAKRAAAEAEKAERPTKEGAK